MIGRLTGTIEHEEPDGSVVVDVQGVGYEVFVSGGAVGRIGRSPEGLVSLYVHTHVREEAIALFGFASVEDRAAFRALLKVNGIGPKLALTIMGAMSAAELQDAVAREDKSAFQGIAGVGKRTVERILVDLRDKLDFAARRTTGVQLRAVRRAPSSTADTVVDALMTMGYKRSEAESAVDTALGLSEDDNVSGLLRAALSALS